MGLFNKKEKKEKSGSPAENPYARAPPTDPYTQAKAQAYSQGPPSQAPGGGLPSGPSAGRSGGLPSGPGAGRQQNSGYGGGGYGGSQAPSEKSPAFTTGGGNRYGSGGGYGGGGYGASNPYGASSGGYGDNKYGGEDKFGGTGAPAQSTTSRYGAGGYGGMSGGADEDDNRGALFGGAKDRADARKAQGEDNSAPPPAYGSEQGGASGASNPYQGSMGGYGQQGGYNPGPAYGDRQLTAEEEEEEDVQATKHSMRQMKQEDVSSTRNALRIAQQAEETGRDTLARLGAQGEMMHNTKKNLDLAHNQNRIAEEKAKELKTLNRSMFAVHVSNPFTAGSRRTARDQAVIDKHLDEKERREADRRAAYQADQRMQQNFKEVEKQAQQSGKSQRNLAERSKYQFEADSEDEQMEDEIDSNLDALHGATKRLGTLARVTGDEVDRQNKLLSDIHNQGDKVDLGLAANRAKIDRIGR